MTLRKKIIVFALLVLIVLIGFDNYLINKTSDFDTQTINQSYSEFTKEEKDKMYIDAMANALEDSIIQSYVDLIGATVEIQKDDGAVSILVRLDIDAQNEMKSSEIDEIKQFVLFTVVESSAEHLKIVDQNGNRLN